MKKIIIAFLPLLLFARCTPEKILSSSQMQKLGTDELIFEIADKNPNVLFLRLKDTVTDVRARDFIVSIQDINERSNEIKNNRISRSDLAMDENQRISLLDVPKGVYIAKLYRFYGNGKSSWQEMIKECEIIRP